MFYYWSAKLAEKRQSWITTRYSTGLAEQRAMFAAPGRQKIRSAIAASVLVLGTIGVGSLLSAEKHAPAETIMVHKLNAISPESGLEGAPVYDQGAKIEPGTMVTEILERNNIFLPAVSTDRQQLRSSRSPRVQILH